MNHKRVQNRNHHRDEYRNPSTIQKPPTNKPNNAAFMARNRITTNQTTENPTKHSEATISQTPTVRYHNIDDDDDSEEVYQKPSFGNNPGRIKVNNKHQNVRINIAEPERSVSLFAQ